MTGDLCMGSFKITNVGNPEDGRDVVIKRYADNLLDFNVYTVGRYVVFSKEDGDKICFSVRTKKMINLLDRLQIELKNNIANAAENKINNVQDAVRQSDFTILPANKTLDS